MPRRYADITFPGHAGFGPDDPGEPPEVWTAEEQARGDWLDEFPLDSLDAGDGS